MKKTRFTETQIVKAIQEHENGRDAKELCRELGITTASSLPSVPSAVSS
jgi:putative transposase